MPGGRHKGPRSERECPSCGSKFEVIPSSKKRYCSKHCYNKSDERRETFRAVAVKLHQDPIFSEANRRRSSESITRYNKSEKGRATSSKMALEKARRINNDEELSQKRTAVARERIIRLNNDPDFVKKRDAATSRSLKQRHKDKAFSDQHRERARIKMINNNQDPEFCIKRDVAHSKTMTRQIKDKVFGKAQRLLFNQLIETDHSLEDYLKMEKIIYLNKDIIERYPMSNTKYYRIDIALVINGVVCLAIEVDGTMRHSTEIGSLKDSTRDAVLLNEFNIPTIRVSNDHVFKNVEDVCSLLAKRIRTVLYEQTSTDTTTTPATAHQTSFSLEQARAFA